VQGGLFGVGVGCVQCVHVCVYVWPPASQAAYNRNDGADIPETNRIMPHFESLHFRNKMCMPETKCRKVWLLHSYIEICVKTFKVCQVAIWAWLDARRS